MRETKTDKVRRLLDAGLSSADIAKIAGVTVKRIGVIRWAMRNPGYYAERMRNIRASDPTKREEERAQHREYRKRRQQANA